MRRTILALTAVVLASTAARASTAGREPVGDFESRPASVAVQKRQILPPEVALQRGNMILAKGDQSGTGPGLGGQKGQKKGGHKGKQTEGKDNPGKQKGQEKGKS